MMRYALITLLCTLAPLAHAQRSILDEGCSTFTYATANGTRKVTQFHLGYAFGFVGGMSDATPVVLPSIQGGTLGDAELYFVAECAKDPLVKFGTVLFNFMERSGYQPGKVFETGSRMRRQAAGGK